MLLPDTSDLKIEKKKSIVDIFYVFLCLARALFILVLL